MMTNAGNSHLVRNTLGPEIIGEVLSLERPKRKRHDTWTQHGFSISIARFWRRVEVAENGCWLWTGAKDRQGYGRWSSPYWTQVGVHRVAWEMLRGMPPGRATGLEIDHRCHVEDETCFGGPACPHRSCVNPDHLRIVTKSQNASETRYRYVTHCVHGHPRAEHLYVNPKTGQRTCRECIRIATRAWLDKGDNRERQNRMRNERRAS